MALDTFERSAPPIFRQGLSAISKLVLLGLLSILLMAADHRLKISYPVRAGIAMVLAPLQWLSLQPGRAAQGLSEYFVDLDKARDAAQSFQARSIGQTQRLQQVEQLLQENAQLRELLDLRKEFAGPSKPVQVLYATTDAYSERVIVDRGHNGGIEPGSAVIDAAGVFGQITRVYPLISEVTLLTDRDQSIPVMNARTGTRHVANGDPNTLGGSLELKFVPAGADMKEGDLLTTSGIDGVYPAGLHVGTITQIDRRIDSSFARVHAKPMAVVRGRHLLVLAPVKDWPALPAPVVPVKNHSKHKTSATPAAAASGVKP
ncbi:rod shape-determining protein MreC [Limnohabitans lacus]|jgi:rod shape-determining protein MreC|uniref:Cell shape-determining protein MreC n=1 Tax=Limnohabitans lacus TaxID=3045173 RepID=A0ABT6X8J2_9BURK|nr:rod shape-determining protein MreC [Limnohabitans sp. HM2-2]MDI9234448.1 rod shape-determining protein MreC [Limnohabitans sp. HM2-2]